MDPCGNITGSWSGDKEAVEEQ